MKNLIVGIIIGMAVAVAADLIFYHNSTMKAYFPNSSASISIDNKSEKAIKKLVFEHEKGVLEASGLKDKERVNFIFQTSAENDASLTVTFDDGAMLTKQIGYFETGYRLQATITCTEILYEL